VDKTTAWNRDEIRARLMVLAGEDPSRRHGRYELRPALSEEQVRRFEQRYGVTLPESYRSFVTTVGDGGARGQVWFDHLGIDSTLAPGPDFRDWYLGWLWPEWLWSPRK
jgi:hypothetical protein